MHVPRKTGELDESSFSRSRMTARLMRRAERFREADEACQCGATRGEEKMQSWGEQIHAVGSAVGFEFCKTVAGSGKNEQAQGNHTFFSDEHERFGLEASVYIRSIQCG